MTDHQAAIFAIIIGFIGLFWSAIAIVVCQRARLLVLRLDKAVAEKWRRDAENEGK